MYVPIDPNKEYTPREIYKGKFILNTVGNSDYRYILRLINAGKLRARIVSIGTQKYYVVKGEDILTWKKATYNVPKQPTTIERKKSERYPYPQAPVTDRSE